MTNHPSFQPSLRRDNVTVLLNRLHGMKPNPMMSLDYAAGYMAAKGEAEQWVSSMWQAAIIAAEAHRLDMEEELDRLDNENTGNKTNDTLGELSSIASDLLDLADRLDNVED